MTAVVSMRRFPKKTPLVFGFVILGLAVWGMVWLNSDYAGPFRYDIRCALLERLVNVKPLPPGGKVDVVYVLGGDQKSLEYKYQKAAELMKAGIANRIWVLDLPGIAEYCEKMGRNYTKNEWSIAKLSESGVSEENIEAVHVNKNFFGTFSEARDVSALLKQRGYKSIMLIAQRYHTQRITVSFMKFLSNADMSIYIQASDEEQMIREMVMELVKLFVYKYFLL